MFVSYLVTAIVMAVALLGSATAKLTRNQYVVDNLTKAGVPLGIFPFLATCEIAGAVGLVGGIWYSPLGLVAAIGVVLYFVGAIGAHMRTRDFKGVWNAVAFFVFSVAVLTLRVLSL